MTKQMYFVQITPFDDTNVVLDQFDTGESVLKDAKKWMDDNLESHTENLKDGEYLAILKCRQGKKVEEENHYIKNIKIIDCKISII